MKIINKIPYLKKWYELGGKPETLWTDYTGNEGEYFNKKVYMSKFWNDTNFKLVSNLFHEFHHAYQDVSGIRAYAVERWGPITNYSQSRNYLEMSAYAFEITLGNQSAIEGFNKYRNRFNLLNR